FFLIGLMILSIGLVSCQQQPIQMQRVTNEQSEINQFLQEQDDIHAFYILENNTDLLVAIQLKSLSRFRKDTLEKKIKKNIENDYTDKSVTVSADYKVLYELNKKKTDKEKQLSKLLKLLKEET